MEKILENEGIALYRTKGQYFLRYDAGELMIKMKNIKITDTEAISVIRSPEIAYNIIIGYQERGVYGEDSIE